MQEADPYGLEKDWDFYCAVTSRMCVLFDEQYPGEDNKAEFRQAQAKFIQHKTFEQQALAMHSQLQWWLQPISFFSGR